MERVERSTVLGVTGGGPANRSLRDHGPTLSQELFSQVPDLGECNVLLALVLTQLPELVPSLSAQDVPLFGRGVPRLPLI